MKPLNVLSLFDGISCGRLALKQARIPVKNYYASEINHRAVRVAMRNHGDIIQMGDVVTVMKQDFREPIDMIIAGSPCQGFSSSGEKLNFDDHRSVLFFEFVRLLRELKPKYFLLENVRMPKEHLDIISHYVGVDPIFVDSITHSAARRQRYYWTNICTTLPQLVIDVTLDNILEEGILYHPYKKKDATNKAALVGNGEKLQCLTKNFHNGNRCMMTDGKGKFRNPTTLEGERAMGLPDNYTAGIEETHRWFVIGDAWNVTTITHFFKQLHPKGRHFYGKKHLETSDETVRDI